MRRAAVLANHDYGVYKVVLLEPGQNEELNSSAGRPWLRSHLGDGWRLVAFCDVEEQACITVTFPSGKMIAPDGTETPFTDLTVTFMRDKRDD
jgi:hypothetical protein